AGHLVRAWTDELIHPALGPATERDPQRWSFRSDSTAVAGTPRAVPRPTAGVSPLAKRGPRTRAAVDTVLGDKTLKRGRVGTHVVGLPDRPLVGFEPEPGEVLE